MPLYNSNRDAGFLLGINKEVMHKLSSVEIAYYKLNMTKTQINIYEEAENRAYDPALRIYGQVMLDQKDTSMGEVQDFERNFTVGFLKSDLDELQVDIEEGDIIEYDGGFYEIDRVSTSNYWSGRNPNTSFAVEFDNQKKHGYAISIVAECHLTRTNALHIVDRRVGNNPNSTSKNTSITKFL